MFLFGSNAFHGFVAVHHRHHDIHQDEVEVEILARPGQQSFDRPGGLVIVGLSAHQRELYTPKQNARRRPGVYVSESAITRGGVRGRRMFMAVNGSGDSGPQPPPGAFDLLRSAGKNRVDPLLSNGSLLHPAFLVLFVGLLDQQQGRVEFLHMFQAMLFDQP